MYQKKRFPYEGMKLREKLEYRCNNKREIKRQTRGACRRTERGNPGRAVRHDDSQTRAKNCAGVSAISLIARIDLTSRDASERLFFARGESRGRQIVVGISIERGGTRNDIERTKLKAPRDSRASRRSARGRIRPGRP